jgi:hypothetical protein
MPPQYGLFFEKAIGQSGILGGYCNVGSAWQDGENDLG